MTALEWDRIGERFFETGVDRGVLYTVGGAAIPWNGLTDIQESSSGEVKSYYMDGVKYLDRYTPGSYSAKLEAFTYPDILDELTGIISHSPGVYLHDQSAKTFHIAYRTGVGSDLDPNLGYKLHIVYNVLAVPSGADLKTVDNNVTPAKFAWDLSSTADSSVGPRPTSHISIQSRLISPSKLASVEDQLYGTSGTNPALPSMADLLTLIANS